MSTQEGINFQPKNDILKTLEEIGIDFSDSRENVLPEVVEAVRNQSIVTAENILRQYGRYLTEQQEEELTVLAENPIILTENDMNKPDAFIDLLNAQEAGKPIDPQNAIEAINNQSLRGRAPAAVHWHTTDGEANFSYIFYNQEDYQRAQEGELDQSPESWLIEKTTEELMHSLDKSDSQEPYTAEEFRDWRTELEILREGAAKSLMQRVLPKEIRTTLSFDPYTTRCTQIYEQLGTVYGNENLRHLYFTGEFPEGITRSDLLTQIRFYNEQYKSQKRRY